jgi:hypothetical protein
MKNPALAAVVLSSSLGLAVAAASCGGSSCGPSNCAGCCSAGVCQPGDTNALCGQQGLRCVPCGNSQTCTAGSCDQSGAGGGCATIAALSTGLGAFYEPDAGAGYSYVDAYLVAPTSTPASLDYLTVELYFPVGQLPTVPSTTALQPTTFAQCEECLYYDEGCDQSGNSCAHDYLGQGGSLTVSSLAVGPDGGVLAGSGTNLHFVEWDYTNDVPLDGGRCVDVSSISYDGSW